MLKLPPLAATAPATAPAASMQGAVIRLLLPPIAAVLRRGDSGARKLLGRGPLGLVKLALGLSKPKPASTATCWQENGHSTEACCQPAAQKLGQAKGFMLQLAVHITRACFVSCRCMAHPTRM
jgi:hypothetical protein